VSKRRSIKRGKTKTVTITLKDGEVAGVEVEKGLSGEEMKKIANFMTNYAKALREGIELWFFRTNVIPSAEERTNR